MTKTHITSAVILCAALVLFCVHAFAADSQFSFTRSTTEGPAVAFAQDQVMLVPLSAADEAGRVTRAPAVQSTADVVPMEDVPYLSAAQVLGAFFPEATLSFQDGVFTATGENLQFQATVGKAYFSVNQQYYYVPTLVVEQAGALFLPAETLAQSLGCSLTQEGEGTLTLQKTGELPTPPTYPEEDLYWLSRAIYSESGNQPMAGRIAVGTVILNRVEDPTFPDTIKEVIFAPGSSPLWPTAPSTSPPMRTVSSPPSSAWTAPGKPRNACISTSPAWSPGRTAAAPMYAPSGTTTSICDPLLSLQPARLHLPGRLFFRPGKVFSVFLLTSEENLL